MSQLGIAFVNNAYKPTQQVAVFDELHRGFTTYFVGSNRFYNN